MNESKRIRLANVDEPRACMSRREFLLSGGLAVAVVAVGAPGTVLAQGQPRFALRAEYPRQRIGSLSKLVTGTPVEFSYPYKDVRNILAVRGSELDWAYLRRWTSEHKTEALLEEIRASIPPL